MSGRPSRIEVLVVDSGRSFLAVARSWLEQHDRVRHVRTSSRGAEVLAALDQRDCDLVLADVALPDMDGFELTRRIKARHDAPVVVLLVLFDYDAFRREAARAGADACLDKTAFSDALAPFLDDLVLPVRAPRRPAPSE